MGDRDNISRITSFLEKITTFKCMKAFVIVGLALKTVFILATSIILIKTWDEKCKVPLKLFIGVYTILLFIQAILFFLKHKDFFSLDRMPDFADNNELSLFSNLVDAFTLFWYLTGLHWTQECTTCKITNKLLYYTTIFIVIFGLIKIVLPLLALVLLVLIISYLNPKIPTVEFDKTKIGEEDARCSICFERYIEHIQLKYLPCGHHFHSECIDGWFNIEELCPLCMKPLNLFHEMIDQPQI